MTTMLLRICIIFDPRPAALPFQMPGLGLDDKITAIFDLVTNVHAVGQGVSLDTRFGRNADAGWIASACPRCTTNPSVAAAASSPAAPSS